ncbi:unnamed protein product [Ectocarpus sp. CCAP 1310/34]|nr:unnamed protein product [Ectocarpus sp. CCAP 1310/34]
MQPSTSPRQTAPPTTNCCAKRVERHLPTFFVLRTNHAPPPSEPRKTFVDSRGAHAEQQEAALKLVEADFRTAWEDLEEGWDHFEEHLIEIGIEKTATCCGEEDMVRRGMVGGQLFGDLFEGVRDERVPRDAAGYVVLGESPACAQHLARMLLARSSVEARVDAPSLLGDDIPAHDRAYLENVSHALGLARAKAKVASAALEALTNVYGPDIVSGKKDEVVELSVRGVRMTTLRSTLTVCPDSVFTTWFNGNWKPTEKDLDKHGGGMLDCKPTVFAKVLDVLRMKKRAGWAPSEDAGGGGVVVKPVPVAVRPAGRACLEEFVNKYLSGCERFIMDLVV